MNSLWLFAGAACDLFIDSSALLDVEAPYRGIQLIRTAARMGSRFNELTANLPAGSRLLAAFGAFICLTFSVSVVLALAMSVKAFLAP
jgi:hypothetical protein